MWLCIIVLTAYLMVSTWRFYSFKEINLFAPQSFRLVVVFGLLLAGILLFSGPVLLGIALTYMFSGVFWRLQWIFRRRETPPAYTEASQAQ